MPIILCGQDTDVCHYSDARPFSASFRFDLLWFHEGTDMMVVAVPTKYMDAFSLPG